jgi:hypothetical protein
MVGATFASRAAGFNQWSYGISFSGGRSGIAAVVNTHRSVAAVLEALLASTEAMIRRIAYVDQLPL